MGWFGCGMEMGPQRNGNTSYPDQQEPAKAIEAKIKSKRHKRWYRS